MTFGQFFNIEGTTEFKCGMHLLCDHLEVNLLERICLGIQFDTGDFRSFSEYLRRFKLLLYRRYAHC